MNHQNLVHILFGGAAFRMLQAGCELGLFEHLNRQPGATQQELAIALGLQARPLSILLRGTTALQLTHRQQEGYWNAQLLTGMFERGTYEILRDLVDFEANISAPAEADFVESLRRNTNVGLRRLPGEGTDLYRRIASVPELQALFYRCMRSWSRLSNPILVDRAKLHGVTRVLDVGGGDGVNAIALADANPDIEFTILDHPGALEIAARRIAERGHSKRIRVQACDIFEDPYPAGHDCVLFANQLVIWSPEENLRLLEKAYRVLPSGGQTLIFSAISDDDESGPLYAALDNVYFATLPTGSSMIYAWTEYEAWLSRVGFSRTERLPGGTWTPHGVLRAWK